MLQSNISLLIILLAVIICFSVSFHKKIQFQKHFGTFLISSTIVAIPFIAWDIYFTTIGVWSFDNAHTMGISAAGLPIEAWLFFYCIPFLSIFTYYILDRYFDLDWTHVFNNVLVFVMTIICVVGALLYHDKIYTFIVLLVNIGVLAYIHFIAHEEWLGQATFVFLILLIGFLLIHSILVGTGIESPIINYNPEHVLGIRFWTVPVENVFYGYSLFLLNIYFFNLLRKRNSKLKRPIHEKTASISNIIALLITILISYLSNTGVFNGNNMATISAKYENLFTPAGYAFSIWGLIYLGLIGFVVYYGRYLFIIPKKEDHTLKDVGWWFVISCLANSVWVLMWVNDYILLSVFVMMILMFSLIKIILNTQMELHNVSLKKFMFLWWPFCFYSGWISVALIANISAYLTKIGWDGFGLSEMTWTVIMILIAMFLNLLMIWKRNMREFALVGVWALVAIAVSNSDGEKIIYWTALIAAFVILINISVHGYQNRKTNPFTHPMKED